MEQISFRPEINNVSVGVEFLRSTLTKWKIPKKRITETLFSAEDVIAELIRKSDGKSDVDIKVFRFPACFVKASCSGETVEITDISDSAGFSSIQNELSDEEKNVIGRLLSDAYRNSISVSNRKNINICHIKVKEAGGKDLFLAAAALILGACFGLLMKYALGAAASEFISENIISTINLVFMNSLKMCLAPLVFLAIISSISGFKNIRALGKIAIVTIVVFLAMSISSIATGYGIYNLIPIGSEELRSIVSDASAVGEVKSVSLVETIKGIVPNNIISPFAENNVLQVMFISFIFGIGMMLLNDEDEFLSTLINRLNDIVNRVIKIIVSFMPLVVFCSAADTVRNVDFKEIIKVFSLIPVCYIGYAALLLLFSIVILVFVHENPIIFFKKISATLVTAFSTSSSSTVIPMTIRCCTEKLGISQKIASFVIPLGNATNKCGSCITHMITILFLAKIFGISVSAAMAASIAVTIIIIKTGAPGVAGGFLVALSATLPSVGIPAEAIGIVMGIFAVVDMGLTLVNVAGDAIASMLISKSFKEFDHSVYISKD